MTVTWSLFLTRCSPADEEQQTVLQLSWLISVPGKPGHALGSYPSHLTMLPAPIWHTHITTADNVSRSRMFSMRTNTLYFVHCLIRLTWKCNVHLGHTVHIVHGIHKIYSIHIWEGYTDRVCTCSLLLGSLPYLLYGQKKTWQGFETSCLDTADWVSSSLRLRGR